MTDTSHRRPAGARTAVNGDERTLWAGWVFFAGAMLIMMGTFQLTQGLVALFDDGYYAVSSAGLVVDVDYNTWGWIHIAIGVVGILVGIGLMAGNLAARIAGVVVAFLSVLVNVAFVSAYPLWSMMVIVIDIIVIYAIVVHGREVESF